MKNNSKNYKAWEIDIDRLSEKPHIYEKIKFFLRFGILAPSTHNTQPWLFRINNDSVDLVPDWRYRLRFGDPDNRNIFISIGCCAKNIECIAAYHGMDCNLSLKGNKANNVYVNLKFSKSSRRNPNLAHLAEYITSRYSNKLKYLSRKIPLNIQNSLKRSLTKGVQVALEDKEDVITEVANLQKRSVLHLANNSQFRGELSNWLRSNKTEKYDGMPGFVVGLNFIQSIVGKVIIRIFPFSFKILAKKDYDLVSSSPLVGVISAKNDKVIDWINIGRVYEEISLLCFSYGISITPLHAVIEDKKISGNLRDLLSIKEGVPRMFFRMGYSSSLSYHTPRRDIEESILSDDALSSERKLAKSLNVNFNIRQINIHGFKINYFIAGSGRPLLLIHGGNIGWGQWYPNITHFSKFFKVYAIDLSGAGRSSRIDFRRLNLQTDLVSVVEEFIKILNITDINIVGSSIGGWIALELAIRKRIQIDKLVLVDSLGFTDYMGVFDRLIGFYPFASLLSKTALRPYRSNKNIEKFLRSVFYNKNVEISNDFINYFYETMKTSHNLLFISRLSSIFGVRREFILKNKLKNVKNKTLIIWGEKDSLMPIERNNSNFNLISNSAVKIIKNAGHIPSIEKSVEFNKLVTAFLLD